MKKIFKNSALAALAVTMAIPVTMTTPNMAQAQSRDAFVGGLVGGIVGGAIGSASQRRRDREVVYVEREPVIVERRVVERRVVRRSSGSAHTDWCFRKYNSYEARSNTYVTYSGRVRQCNSPYN